MKNKQLDTSQAAKYLGVALKKLQNFRSHKKGPKVAKRIGNKCYYNLKDLDKWNESKRNKPFKRKIFKKNINEALEQRKVFNKIIQEDEKFLEGQKWTPGQIIKIKNQASEKYILGEKCSLDNVNEALEEISDIGLDTLGELIDIYKTKYFKDKTIVLILETLLTKLSSITYAVNKLNERKK